MESGSTKNYEMHKRPELMADGRRYIIYYTFGEKAGESAAETNARTPPSAENDAEKSKIK